MANNSDSIQDLVSAQRVMSIMQELDKKRKNPNAATKNLKQIKEEQDQLILSGNARLGKKNGQSAVENFNIQLSDIKKYLENLQSQTQQNQAAQPPVTNQTPSAQGNQTLMNVEAQIEVEQRTEMTYSITALGDSNQASLSLIDKKQAETERYSFDFLSSISFRITDKETMKSTTIWGDPHVDTDDESGELNGEFSDLKASNEYTTFLLLDGTRVTFTAKDNAVIERVDIIVGKQHLSGIGAASKDFSEHDGYFESSVGNDGNLQTSLVPIGDLVLAGGDGNDWYDYRGRLVWGESSGPMASRSGGFKGVDIQVSYTQKIIRKATLMQSE